MVDDTTTLPDESQINTLFAVRGLGARVVAAPVFVACLLFTCVCIARVTIATYANSASVTVDTVVLPPALEITAVLAVKSLVATIIAAPVIVCCLACNKVLTSAFVDGALLPDIVKLNITGV